MTLNHAQTLNRKMAFFADCFLPAKPGDGGIVKIRIAYGGHLDGLPVAVRVAMLNAMDKARNFPGPREIKEGLHDGTMEIMVKCARKWDEIDGPKHLDIDRIDLIADDLVGVDVYALLEWLNEWGNDRWKLVNHFSNNIPDGRNLNHVSYLEVCQGAKRIWLKTILISFCEAMREIKEANFVKTKRP